MTSDYSLDRTYAIHLDEIDPLRKFRKEFYIPKQSNGEEYCYFSGNSLGVQPKRCAAFIEKELEQWRIYGSLGHTHPQNPWIAYHEPLAADLASLVGALPSEVIAMNSLTVNLHLMMVSFYRPTKERYKILVNPRLFSSDRFALQSQEEFHQFDPVDAILPIPANEQGIISQKGLEKILESEGASIALVFMEGVNYVTGQAVDINRIAALAHQKGAVVGFDLAHAIGNRELSLHEAGIDFAVWCSYKYLNGGPGCVGGCFVHEKHHREKSLPRFAGWFGHDQMDRFALGTQFHPFPSVEGWQISNPPILSLASLKASLEIFKEVSLARLRKKSILLTGYLEFLVHQLPSRRLTIITPADPQQRGCQLSVSMKTGARELCERLEKEGFICDFRSPDVIRIAPAPLYNTFLEVYKLYDFLKKEGL